MENVDQVGLGLYIALLLIGLLNVFAVSFSDEVRFFDFSLPKFQSWFFASFIVMVVTCDRGVLHFGRNTPFLLRTG